MSDPLYGDETDRAIAALVLEGASNKQIATRLAIPETRVKWRLHRMYGRLGTSSRTQFALRLRDATEEGEPPPNER